MLDSAEITKRLFILGVCAIAVIPRQHIDRSRWTIGGGTISHPFRKLLLSSLAMNVLRLLCKLLHLRFIADVLGIVQILSLTFLCFVTPYILQTWLASRINVGGRPGANFHLPLYLAAIFSVAGVTLAPTVHSNRWCLNRLGNVITGLPVLKTIQQYNSVTALGGHHAGRGNIFCQTLYIVEIWFMVTQFLCAVGYAFYSEKASADYTLWDTLLEGFRDIAFSSGWTRVLAHAIFVNLLDELDLTSQATSDSPTSRETSDDQVSEIEALIPSRTR